LLGVFGLRITRFLALAVALILLVIGLVLAGFYYGSIHATLRITTGPEGGLAQKFISAFVAGTHAAHPRIDFKTVEVQDLAASAKALEDGKVDLALVRTDFQPPNNGQTLVILRRDVVALVLPPKSSVDSVVKLTGKTVVVPAGPLQEANSRAFDLILNYYNVSPDKVKRVFAPLDQIGAELKKGRAVAVVAVGPIGPGQVVDAVAAVAKATRGTPTILNFDDNDAISARFPALESVDIPQGAFRPRPATPDDDIKGVAVSYRFVVPVTMLDIVAGALGRSVVNTKARLMQLTPLASQIEAPDPSEKSTILPIHPGFAAYLNNGDQSFFDEFQSYAYVLGIPLSLLGSLIAMLTSVLSNRTSEARQKKLFRLLLIADEAGEAERDRLLELEAEYRALVSACVSELLAGELGADPGPVSLAIEHTRRALEERRADLNMAPSPNTLSPPPSLLSEFQKG